MGYTINYDFATKQEKELILKKLRRAKKVVQDFEFKKEGDCDLYCEFEDKNSFGANFNVNGSETLSFSFFKGEIVKKEMLKFFRIKRAQTRYNREI